MTNLNEILYLLDEDVIYEKIDAPIDEILREFYYPATKIITQKEFISMISGFLKELKNQGILLTMELDEFSEVFWFLEKHYSSDRSHGYERALNDVLTYGSNGIEMILEDTTESLKKEQRENFTNWIFDTKIIFLEWNAKLKLIEEFRKQYGILFSPALSNMSKEQQIPFLKELLSDNISNSQTLKSMLTPNRSISETI